MKQLEHLSLGGSKITDKTMTTIGTLSKLEELDLFSVPAVTDAGVRELAGLKNLRRLRLDGTKVTDAGLRSLAALKQLEDLNVGSSGVTAAGVAEFKKAVPGCEVLNLQPIPSLTPLPPPPPPK